MTDEPKDVIVAPRICPRGFADFCLCTFVVLPIQLLILFVLPAAIAFALTRSTTAAIGTAVVAYLVFASFSVSRVSLSPQGIRFHRILGTPKFLDWERVTSVDVAPQRELILRGWLWPMFPAREMTACFSSLQHFRITWDSGFCYYPPADSEVFEKYVTAHLKTRNA
jgi:hypothetical protein